MDFMADTQNFLQFATTATIEETRRFTKLNGLSYEMPA
jgi:hypothetical protein